MREPPSVQRSGLWVVMPVKDLAERQAAAGPRTQSRRARRLVPRHAGGCAERARRSRTTRGHPHGDPRSGGTCAGRPLRRPGAGGRGQPRPYRRQHARCPDARQGRSPGHAAAAGRHSPRNARRHRRAGPGTWAGAGGDARRLARPARLQCGRLLTPRSSAAALRRRQLFSPSAPRPGIGDRAARSSQRPGLALDVDTPEDLRAFLATPSATRGYAFLAESGLAERLLGAHSEP